MFELKFTVRSSEGESCLRLDVNSNQHREWLGDVKVMGVLNRANALFVTATL